jgi:hypothetical protein
MKLCLCIDCAQPMTVEEIHYYESRCENCEQAWSDRIGAWMRRETEEPEMEAMFGGRKR